MTDQDLFEYEIDMAEIEDEPTRPAIPSAMRPPPMPGMQQVTFVEVDSDPGLGLRYALAFSALFWVGVLVGYLCFG